MILICKFQHDGDCCNCGSPQYMCKCKPDICNSVVPITNADRIRKMSDEELEDQLVLEVEGMAPCKMFISIPTGEMFICRQAAKEAVEKWLQQPAEED
mgnify:FL=1